MRVKENGNVVFPYIKGEKERPNPTRPLGEDERRFYFTKGIKPSLYNYADARKPKVFLVEGETDTLRLWQALQDEGVDDVGVVGLSGVDTWRNELALALNDANTVWAILDNDTDYMVVAQVDSAWRDIRRDLGGKVRRLRLPDGTKDVCEFFNIFDLDMLRKLAKRNKPGKSRFHPLDLTKDPPPINWLVEGLVAMGDVNLLQGDGGLGKSWFTMGLTTAIAEGHDEFLGLKLKHGGRVLYVDEENPEDVVKHRLKKLGLSPEAAEQNVRYLHNEGIRLDRNGEILLDEALDFAPTIIVLDSLTRLHTEDENNAGAMATVMNNAIKPLARETGAAVLLIHHVNKSAGDSYKRSRGSVDIVNASDAALDFQPAEPPEPGVFVLKQYRSRRKLGGDEMVVRISDMPDGTVELQPSAPLTPPF